EDDAEQYYKLMTENEKEDESPVDSVSKLNPKTHVLARDTCENLNHMFDVTLTKVEVRSHQYGTYMFYRMQVIHDVMKDMYILWNRWGRIGEEGAYQRTPFNSLEEASKEFKKI